MKKELEGILHPIENEEEQTNIFDAEEIDEAEKKRQIEEAYKELEDIWEKEAEEKANFYEELPEPDLSYLDRDDDGSTVIEETTKVIQSKEGNGIGVYKLKRLGIIIYKFEQLYIVHIGLGRIKYCKTLKKLEVGEIILFKGGYLSDEIDYMDRLSNYTYIGNLRYDYDYTDFALSKEYPQKVIARKESFVMWERIANYCDNSELDKASNYLLFLYYADNRFSKPSESDFLEAYKKAREKVESLNVPKAINELKVNINVFEQSKKKGGDRYSYGAVIMQSFYSFIGDEYLESLFPSVDIVLHSWDEYDEEEYTNEEYPDSFKRREYAAQKEAELKAQAMDVLINKYDIEEHINHIAFKIISPKEYNYDRDEKYIQTVKSRAELFWKEPIVQNVINEIRKTSNNYKDVINEHNSKLSIYSLL